MRQSHTVSTYATQLHVLIPCPADRTESFHSEKLGRYSGSLEDVSATYSLTLWAAFVDVQSLTINSDIFTCDVPPSKSTAQQDHSSC